MNIGNLGQQAPNQHQSSDYQTTTTQYVWSVGLLQIYITKCGIGVFVSNNKITG